MMELRSHNVIRVYNEVVKCRIKNDLGVIPEKLEEHAEDIKSMVSQILRDENSENVCTMCCMRNDQEKWTPYLQVVEMIILLGIKLKYIEVNEPLTDLTKIKFKI